MNSLAGDTEESDRALRSRTLTFLAHCREKTVDGPSSAMRLVGVGTDGIHQGLSALERRTRVSVWNTQSRSSLPDFRLYEELNRLSRERHIQRIGIVAGHADDYSPVLRSVLRESRVGPVYGPMLLVDQECLVIGGAPHPNGRGTAYATTERALVHEALAIWRSTLARSVPMIAPGTRAPLTTRQVEVALMLVAGLSDHQMSRTLNCSERTISAELARLREVTNTTTRSELAANVAADGAW